MTKKGRKYPELIGYYQIKGYDVTTDSDLRDVHAWIPFELYARLVSESLGRFNVGRGRISKAISEALEHWIKDENHNI